MIGKINKSMEKWSDYQEWKCNRALYITYKKGGVWKLLIVMDEIGFIINIPVKIKVLIALIALICCILLALYYRFSHFRKRIHFNLNSVGSTDILGPKEWENKGI